MFLVVASCCYVVSRHCLLFTLVYQYGVAMVLVRVDT